MISICILQITRPTLSQISPEIHPSRIWPFLSHFFICFIIFFNQASTWRWAASCRFRNKHLRQCSQKKLQEVVSLMNCFISLLFEMSRLSARSIAAPTSFSSPDAGLLLKLVCFWRWSFSDAGLLLMLACFWRWSASYRLQILPLTPA